MFGCTPSEAERQDPALVHHIADYRAAQRAIALINSGEKGVEELQKQPGLIDLLHRMERAQLE